MRKIALSLFASLATVTVGAGPAFAQATRTWVSGVGDDINPCSRTAPCKTFAGAIAKTVVSGEINCLDPLGFGSVTINKSITIDCHDMLAAILARGSDSERSILPATILVSPGETGITIDAPRNAVVNLRGLVLDGGGEATNGIFFLTGRSLTIEKTVIRNMSVHGINFSPNVASNLTISGTVISENRDGIAILAKGPGVRMNAVISGVAIHGNSGIALAVDGRGGPGTIRAVVTDTIVRDNGADGFRVTTSAEGAKSEIMLIRSESARNGIGVSAVGPGATVRVTESKITNNVNDWRTINSGALLSYGDNRLDGNVPSDEQPLTILSK